MINIYNCSWLDKLYGLTVWPFIFYRAKVDDISPCNVKHEEYHYHHQARWLVLPWFIVYGFLFLFHGYKNHPWEVLAREAENERD